MVKAAVFDAYKPRGPDDLPLAKQSEDFRKNIRDIAIYAIVAYEAALAEAGYVIVPDEPIAIQTEAGRDAALGAIGDRDRFPGSFSHAQVADDIYRAMIHAGIAAPKVDRSESAEPSRRRTD